MTTTTDSTLTVEQQQRAEALDRARGALATRSGGLTPGTTGPDAIDLVNVAQYIVTGDDPWESSITRIATAAADTAATALGDAIGNTTTTGGEDGEDQ
ncbi:hypothetical protein [Gordonia sp. SND2]|uniref:hypothetical protein n=1 Tax=Gordonia sp. SND2 TaxID=3388659 RepID=UPI00398B7B9A